MIHIGDRIRCTVEKLVFGGQGLIRHQGWVIFVPDVAEGEEVEVEIVAKKKSYFVGSLCQVIVPSPKRKTPPCPYFGTCGGCQLQHLAYEEQLRLKVEWLKEVLSKIAKIALDFPIVAEAAKKAWSYRRKITLHGPDGGFYARDNRTIIEIKRCLIFSENELPRTKKNKLVVMRDEADNFIFDSDEMLTRNVEGLSIFYNTQVFVQNDPSQALQIYRDVLDTIDTGPILDLYCGVGILSLLAASRGHKVLGVEWNKKAIQFAKMSAEENALNGAQFEAMACEEIEKLPIEKYPFWILNPPRTGLSPEVAKIVVEKAPVRLVYISCMPSTLARDVRILYDHGYRIERAKVYDMFAQTTHLETVLFLKK